MHKTKLINLDIKDSFKRKYTTDLRRRFGTTEGDRAFFFNIDSVMYTSNLFEQRPFSEPCSL
jgi:hypothetical protein